MKLTESLNTFENLELPETLYKYRDWEIDRHKTIITNREVWFASPSTFPDELDCRIPTRYDSMSNEDILNLYFSVGSLDYYPIENIGERMEFAVNWANTGLMTNREHLENRRQETFKSHHARAGVLSLTAYCQEPLMWKKYANCYSGFCVGLDPKIMLKEFEGGGGPVFYYDELPIIHTRPKHSLELQSFLQIYSKLRNWEFEKEYRANIFRYEPLTDDDRRRFVPPEAYKEIIFGAGMPRATIKRIIQSIPPEIKHVKLRANAS